MADWRREDQPQLAPATVFPAMQGKRGGAAPGAAQILSSVQPSVRRRIR